VTGGTTRAYGLALLAGLPLALLLASSCVALHYRFASELGAPLWWRLYDPLAVVRWARAWGLSPGHRGDFLRALSLAIVPGVLPAALLRLREMRAPPVPEERPAGSRLGTAADLRRLGTFRHAGPGIVVGLDGRRPLFETGDVHALVLGPTRTGKGVNNIVPTLLTWTESALVLDFKGELASVCGPMRAHVGEVYTIDATSPRSARFNPLLSLRTGPEMVTDAQALAHMLVHPDLDVRAGDTIWNDATALTVTALLIAARLSPEPTLGHFYRLQGDLQAKRPIACEHPWAADMLDRVWNAWPDKTRGSVLFNLDTRLAFLASELVQAVVSGHDFAAEDLMVADRPVTVFVGTPLDMADAMLPLHRLLFASLLRPLTASLRRTRDGRLKRRKLLLLLDEFPSLGKLPTMERNMANLAGYGVRALLCAQDEMQVARVYGEKHALAANCRVRVYSASLSEESLKREQTLAGSESVIRRGGSRSGPWFGRQSSSWSEGTAPLVETGELMQLSLSHVVVFAPGLRRPVVLPKMRYFEHRYFRGLFGAEDDPRVGLWPQDRPLPAPPPAPAAPAGVTLNLTTQQADALRKRCKPGETLEQFLARFAATAGARKPKSPEPPATP
jgi:type IV secretion system protein VirD4